MIVEKPPLSTFWLLSAAVFLSLAWLLPNHYPPWLAFHGDAWTALVITAAAAFVLRRPLSVHWHWASVVVGVICLIPIAQYAFGQIAFVGQAWINVAYLLGFLCSMLIAAHWERQSTCQAADFLFFALCLAGIASVGFQLHQWLQLDSLEFFVLRASDRPYGNLGQPNQLASLLVLATLGCGWGFWRKTLAAKSAVLLACFFLFGIALTHSRTSWLNMTVIFLVMGWWGWRQSRFKLMAAATGLAGFLAACIFITPWLFEVLQLHGTFDLSNRLSESVRPLAWRLLLDAVWQKPLLGYGWGQTGSAHLQTAADYPYIGVLFEQAHNLFIDLLIWNGMPVGLFICVAIVGWFVAALASLKNIGDALILLCLSALGVHAMLEYPLHYAYFLLPAGLMVGMLHTRLGFHVVFSTAPKVAWCLWLCAAVVLAVTVRDYLRVESSFTDLRFEKARIVAKQAGTPPEVWVLTQLRENIVLGRTEARANMTTDELNWMRSVTQAYPSANNIYKLALALALNQHGAEAQQWIKALCKTAPVAYCESSKGLWKDQAAKAPAIAAVPWP